MRHASHCTGETESEHTATGDDDDYDDNDDDDDDDDNNILLVLGWVN